MLMIIIKLREKKTGWLLLAYVETLREKKRQTTNTWLAGVNLKLYKFKIANLMSVIHITRTHAHLYTWDTYGRRIFFLGKLCFGLATTVAIAGLFDG